MYIVWIDSELTDYLIDSDVNIIDSLEYEENTFQSLSQEYGYSITYCSSDNAEHVANRVRLQFGEDFTLYELRKRI